MADPIREQCASLFKHGASVCSRQLSEVPLFPTELPNFAYWGGKQLFPYKGKSKSRLLLETTPFGPLALAIRLKITYFEANLPANTGGKAGGVGG